MGSLNLLVFVLGEVPHHTASSAICIRFCFTQIKALGYTVAPMNDVCRHSVPIGAGIRMSVSCSWRGAAWVNADNFNLARGACGSIRIPVLRTESTNWVLTSGENDNEKIKSSGEKKVVFSRLRVYSANLCGSRAVIHVYHRREKSGRSTWPTMEYLSSIYSLDNNNGESHWKNFHTRTTTGRVSVCVRSTKPPLWWFPHAYGFSLTRRVDSIRATYIESAIRLRVN